MPQPGYEAAGSPPPPPASQPVGHTEGKKKRAYAAQAYEFGAGANSALGGQQQGGGAYPQAQTAGYGGYAQQPGFQQPSLGNDQGVSTSGASAIGFGQPAAPGAGGYQPPDATYPGTVAGSPSMAGVTSSFNQMNIGPGQMQSQPPTSQQRLALNQLYPTDLFSQPFNVSELDLPPPPIVLPPNVRLITLWP